ncbi:hypothetical protein LTR22_022162 [Elasticomyces elasticus]|nr:hypothetical protein LTR22_022162 [Elasticomyces elasticus]KAK5753517.1 hypothetical protein LTS12_016357 [Elasticomyces elasticus]
MSQPNTNDRYPLPRNTSETSRLNEQHKYLVEAFGFHIHPRIPAAHKDRDFKVADIACGSGIWLTEVAAKYPQAQCVGFDISDKQFPAASDLETSFAKRVQFHAQDATAEEGYGAEFRGQFDVVAVRLLHVSIAGAQWTRAVKNAAALLKPNGFMQWQDWSPTSAHVVQSRPLLKRAAIDQLMESFGEFLAATDSGATARLAQEMRESGLVDVQSELFALDVDPGWRKYFLWTMTHVMPDILQARVPKGRAAEEWAKLKADAQEEAEQEGLWVRTEIYCHVGQKPE